jgi:YesN/AraC family two-component response regulator
MNAALKFNVGTYLLKPFTQDELVTAIEKALATRKEFKHAV